MNKVLSFAIILSMTSICGMSAMDRGEGVAEHPHPTQKELDALLRRQRELAKRRRQVANQENNPPARRNLGAELDLYQPNRGEGTHPINNRF